MDASRAVAAALASGNLQQASKSHPRGGQLFAGGHEKLVDIVAPLVVNSGQR